MKFTPGYSSILVTADLVPHIDRHSASHFSLAKSFVAILKSFLYPATLSTRPTHVMSRAFCRARHVVFFSRAYISHPSYQLRCALSTNSAIKKGIRKSSRDAAPYKKYNSFEGDSNRFTRDGERSAEGTKRRGQEYSQSPKNDWKDKERDRSFQHRRNESPYGSEMTQAVQKRFSRLKTDASLSHAPQRAGSGSGRGSWPPFDSTPRRAGRNYGDFETGKGQDSQVNDFSHSASRERPIKSTFEDREEKRRSTFSRSNEAWSRDSKLALGRPREELARGERAIANNDSWTARHEPRSRFSNDAPVYAEKGSRERRRFEADSSPRQSSHDDSHLADRGSRGFFSDGEIKHRFGATQKDRSSEETPDSYSRSRKTSWSKPEPTREVPSLKATGSARKIQWRDGRSSEEIPVFRMRTNEQAASNTSSFAQSTEDRPLHHSNEPVSIVYTTPASEFLYGTSVIIAALSSVRRKLYKLYEYAGERRSNREESKIINNLARACRLEVVKITREAVLDKMSGGRPHNVSLD